LHKSDNSDDIKIFGYIGLPTNFCLIAKHNVFYCQIALKKCQVIYVHLQRCKSDL